jgi:hypothetical protein
VIKEEVELPAVEVRTDELCLDFEPVGEDGSIELICVAVMVLYVMGLAFLML